MLKQNIILSTIPFLLILVTIIPNIAYGQELGTIELEIHYTNGDIANFNGMNIIIYQDFDKTPIFKKTLESNPDFITMPIGYKYKVEVYANGMYADVDYIDLQNSQEKLLITIPLSGGLKINVFFERGEIPIKNATVVIKSYDGIEWRKGQTNDQGDTIRYWIQSTNKLNEFYVAEIYLDDILVKTQSNIRLQAGIAQDQKITVPIPAINEDLTVISLFKTDFIKITTKDGTFSVKLNDQEGNTFKESTVNRRGEAQFSNVPSGKYIPIVLKNGIEDKDWPQLEIFIIGQESEFGIHKIESVEQNQIPVNDISTIEETIATCNCVAFRFDDVQDYWLNDVQIALMETFTRNNIPLTIGIVANAFGDDVKITNFVRNNINKLEIASHGTDHSLFTEFDAKEQNSMLKQSSDNIFNSLGVKPTTFIPPENRFNENTKQALVDNGFTHLSASILHGDLPPFPLEGETLYRFPEISTTGIFEPEQSLFVGLPNGITFSQTVEGLEKYGFAVITSHPQEFSTIINGTYVNKVNQEQINELEILIQKIQEKNIKIVLIGKINLDSQSFEIPPWIKNNARWWAEEQIDDETFMKGIQFLIQENIIKVSEKSQTEPNEQNIPPWIKNNARWWAEEQIDDETFMKGIEYLVKNGIITY